MERGGRGVRSAKYGVLPRFMVTISVEASHPSVFGYRNRVSRRGLGLAGVEVSRIEREGSVDNMHKCDLKDEHGVCGYWHMRSNAGRVVCGKE